MLTKWDEFCKVRGWSVWCVNEGKASSSEEVTLTEEEAEACGFKVKTELDYGN